LIADDIVCDQQVTNSDLIGFAHFLAFPGKKSLSAR